MSRKLKGLFGRGRSKEPERPQKSKTVRSGETSDLPRVAVVILNYNGQHHLSGCFGSLEELDYPPELVDVWLVDNGSNDDSVEYMRANFSDVNLLQNERNRGFSVGCNQGAAAADADVLVFLNNDMRVEPSWLRELVRPIVAGEAAATTAKMMSWDGKRIDSSGGGMNFHGIGIQKGYRDEPGPEHDKPGPSLFACGGAMAIDARVFADVGGFDEEFFAYYEDVDLGWRLWVFGHRIAYVPSAVCYHHHSSTSRRFPPETIRLLQVRNPILACFKNYDDAHLRQILPAMLALATRRALLVSGLDDVSDFRIEDTEPVARGVVGRLFEKARHSVIETVPMGRMAAADLIGINDLLGNFEHWSKRRTAIQARRKRPDAEIFELFGKPFWCIEDDSGYRELQHGMQSFFGIDELFEGLEENGKDPFR